MADVIHSRMLKAVNWTPTHINSLTAGTPAAIRIPIHFANDRECLERIAPTVGKVDPSQVTIGWIRNSLEISTLGLSENLLPEIKSNPALEMLGPARDLPFNLGGDLPQCETFIGAQETAHAGH